MRNFAIMRHGIDDFKGLQANSKKVCQRVARELSEKMDGEKVIIFHSPLLRTKRTADELLAGLISAKINACILGPLSWLDCGKLSITNKNIRQAVSAVGYDKFIVFITHRQDMDDYLNRAVGIPIRISNCTLFSPEFIIPGH